MACFSRPFLLASALVVAGGGLLVSCGSELPPPYYAFSADDQAWMQAKPGEEWVFENGQGKRHRFQVDTVLLLPKQKVRGGSWFGSSDVESYYDEWWMYISSADSANMRGSLHFAAGTVGRNDFPKDRALFGELRWYSYIGSTYGTNFLQPERVNFASDNFRELTFQPLPVGSQFYPQVAEASTSGTPPQTGYSSAHTYIRQLFYDQRAGIVRMVSATGEVWNRVP